MTTDTREVDLDITGMTCASCANRIERKLNKLDGVTASVNYATERARVSFPETVSADDLVATVAAAGYAATLPSPDPEPEDDGERPDPELMGLQQRLLVSALLSLPVVLMAMVPALQLDGWQWLSLTLAAPVVVWGAWPFHRAALVNLRHGSTTMDTLVSVGVLAAFGWSLVALFLGSAGMIGMTHEFRFTIERTNGLDNVYFEAAAGVTTFLLAGRWFEKRSKRRAGAALRALLDLGAKDVTVLRGGVEERVPAGELAVGDLFVVRPGEKVATDGVVESGTSALDASMLTGEQERRHACRGLEVDVVEPVGALQGEAERVLHADHARAAVEQRDERPAERRQHADRDQGVHRRAPVAQVHQRGAVERPGSPDDDRRRQGERQPLPAVRLQRRHHRQQHDRHAEQGRDQQALAQRVELGVALVLLGRGRLVGRHRGGVPGRGDGRQQLVGRDRGRVGHERPLGGVVDAGGDALELVELALDPVGARSAGHAGDVELHVLANRVSGHGRPPRSR